MSSDPFLHGGVCWTSPQLMQRADISLRERRGASLASFLGPISCSWENSPISCLRRWSWEGRESVSLAASILGTELGKGILPFSRHVSFRWNTLFSLRCLILPSAVPDPESVWFSLSRGYIYLLLGPWRASGGSSHFSKSQSWVWSRDVNFSFLWSTKSVITHLDCFSVLKVSIISFGSCHLFHCLWIVGLCLFFF